MSYPARALVPFQLSIKVAQLKKCRFLSSACLPPFLSYHSHTRTCNHQDPPPCDPPGASLSSSRFVLFTSVFLFFFHLFSCNNQTRRSRLSSRQQPIKKQRHHQDTTSGQLKTIIITIHRKSPGNKLIQHLCTHQ